MMDLYKEWKPATCTFSTEEDGQKISATVYIDGKKMRYTTQSNLNGEAIISNLILKDNYSYTWSSMDKKNWVKIKNDEFNEDMEDQIWWEDEIDEWNQLNWDDFMNSNFEYDCKWWVENWVFNLPTDVDFQEFTIPSFPDMSLN
jgi:hypothetical protein